MCSSRARLRQVQGAIEELSVKWDWVSRALADDGHLDRERRAANERALREMIDRQARLGQAMRCWPQRRSSSSRGRWTPIGCPQPARSRRDDSRGFAARAGGSRRQCRPEDPSERVSAFERAVIEAIEQADVVTAQRVRHAIYLLGAHTGSPSVR